MATYNKFQDFVEQLWRGNHDFANDVTKVYLSNTAANNTMVSKENLAEISAANGYNTANVSQNIAEAAGVVSIKGVSVVWTANGGNFGPFDKVIWFNANTATPANGLISWWEYGSSISCNNGESFTWATPANNLLANCT